MRIVGGLFAAVIVVAIAAFIVLQPIENAPNTSVEQLETTTVTIADARQTAFALVYVAEAEGFFADEGIELEYSNYTSGRDAIQSVVDGENQIGTVFSTPVILQASAGEDIAILSELHDANQNNATVARKGAGIETVEDLAGKRVGVTLGTGGELFLLQLLEKAGLTVDDVTIVDTAPSEMDAAFKNAEVDAVSTWNPHVFNIQRAYTENDIVTFFNEEYYDVSMLVSMGSFAKENPEAVASIQRALDRAEEYLSEQNVDGVEDVVAHLSDQPGSTIRAVWPNYTFAAGYSDTLWNALENEAQWLIENGRISADASTSLSQLAVE